jgi:hypothetical protein
MSADLYAVPISHPAQKQVLMDLLSKPRFRVAKDMGW